MMTEAQYLRVVQTARAKNIKLSECPVCGHPRVEVDPGIWIWEESSYKLDGKMHECDCEWYDLLRRHYLLADLPMDYWTLSESEWWGDPMAFDFVVNYLDHWHDNKRLGMGAELYSPTQGVGKTMLAVIIAKELIRNRESVVYTTFRDAVSVLIRDPDETERLRNVPVLILDELAAGWTDAQHHLFADQLEDLIRFRTSGASVTIITTNLTPDDMQETFGRSYSLLSAKQYRYHVKGVDTRADGTVKLRKEELIANGENLPLT
jgi:hypothetical protein